jgi:hypothetical protein
MRLAHRGLERRAERALPGIEIGTILIRSPERAGTRRRPAMLPLVAMSASVGMLVEARRPISFL